MSQYDQSINKKIVCCFLENRSSILQRAVMWVTNNSLSDGSMGSEPREHDSAPSKGKARSSCRPQRSAGFRSSGSQFEDPIEIIKF